MPRRVEFDDGVLPTIDLLSEREQRRLDRMTKRLRSGGIEGIPASHVRRLPPDVNSSDDASVFLVRMSPKFRAFVALQDDRIVVLDVAPKRRLREWKSLSAPGGS